MNMPIRTLLLILLLATASCSLADKDKSKRDSELYLTIGNNHLVEKKYPEALDAYLRAIRLDSENLPAHMNASLVYYFRDKMGLAIKYAEMAVDLDPKNSNARNNLGFLYMKNKQYDKAIDQFDIAAADLLYIEVFKPLTNKGEIMFEQGRYKLAVKLFKKALHYKPDFCRAHYLLGRCYLKMNSLPKAKKAFTDAIKGICTTQIEAHFYLGVTYMRLKDKKKARSEFLYLAEKVPGDTYGKKAIEYLPYVE